MDSLGPALQEVPRSRSVAEPATRVGRRRGAAVGVAGVAGGGAGAELDPGDPDVQAPELVQHLRPTVQDVHADQHDQQRDDPQQVQGGAVHVLDEGRTEDRHDRDGPAPDAHEHALEERERDHGVAHEHDQDGKRRERLPAGEDSVVDAGVGVHERQQTDDEQQAHQSAQDTEDRTPAVGGGGHGGLQGAQRGMDRLVVTSWSH